MQEFPAENVYGGRSYENQGDPVGLSPFRIELHRLPGEGQLEPLAVLEREVPAPNSDSDAAQWRDSFNRQREALSGNRHYYGLPLGTVEFQSHAATVEGKW